LLLTAPALGNFGIIARHKRFVAVSVLYCRTGRGSGGTTRAFGSGSYFAFSSISVKFPYCRDNYCKKSLTILFGEIILYIALSEALNVENALFHKCLFTKICVAFRIANIHIEVF
jgi:hypothetical protein